MQSKNCKHCGEEFKPRIYNQVFCNVKCREKHWSNKYYAEHKEKLKAKTKTPEYKSYQRIINKQDHVKSRRNEWMKEKVHNDPIYRLKTNISRSLRKVFPGVFKKSKLEDVLGYSIESLWDHLKTTIPQGFSEDDYLSGELQLDHIIPQTLYYAFSPGDDEFRKCWNFRNLRLLEKKKNNKKHENVCWDLIVESNLDDLFPASIGDIVSKIQSKDLLLENLGTNDNHHK